MRSLPAFLVVVATLVLASVAPSRASVFTFAISGPNISGSGTLTGLPDGALYDATGSTGSLTIYGQRIDITRAAGTFSRTLFQLQLYNDSTESALFRGTATGGTFTSSVAMQLGTYLSFDVEDAPHGSGGAPLPEAGTLASLLLAGGIAGLVALRRTRWA